MGTNKNEQIELDIKHEMRYSIRIGQDGKSRGICCGNKRYQDGVRKLNI